MIEKLWDIPVTWAWTEINELGEVVSGGTPSTKEMSYWGNDVNWISPSDLTGYNHKTIARGAKNLTIQGLKNSSAKVMPAGSIHFSSRAPIGYVVISSEPLSTNQGFKSLVPAEGLFNEYIYYYFKSAKQLAEQRATGTTFKEISGTAFGKLPFPLPPANEQKRIVAKIEELFSELDKGIENLKTAREQLKVYRQAILKYAFEQKGGKKTTLGELLSYITSGSRGWAEYYSDSGELFIRAQNLKYDRLDLTDCAYVSIPNKTEGTRTKIQQGDLLITITGANVTKSALIERDLGTAYVSQHVALCRPIEEVLPKFLYWFVVAEAAGRKQLSSAAYGAGKPGLNLDNIKSVQVTIPSYEQQAAVVKIIEEKLSVCDELEQEIERNIQKSEALRQSILKKAFSGKLVAQDLNDEPASVLLEHIHAEKEAQKTEGKKPKVKREAA